MEGALLLALLGELRGPCVSGENATPFLAEPGMSLAVEFGFRQSYEGESSFAEAGFSSDGGSSTRVVSKVLVGLQGCRWLSLFFSQ
jgi:hypothetical protein